MHMVPYLQILIGQKDMSPTQLESIRFLREAGAGGQRLKKTAEKLISRHLQASNAGAPDVVVSYVR